MKKGYVFFSGIFLLILSACTQRVYLTVREPAAVQLHLDLLNGGVINRSFGSGNESKIVDVIDKTLSLEGNLDNKGSNAAVEGAYNHLITNERFSTIKLLDSMTVKDRSPSAFPQQIAWTQVDPICITHDLDFLLVLEMYDTDSKINYSQRAKTQKTPLGDVSVIEHTATLTTFIKTGWRIYDNRSKVIVDEFYINDRLVSTGTGINPVMAATAIMNRSQNVQNISNNIGRNYASRLNPQFFRVWRNYYNKGSKDLKIANRRAEVGDWDGAGELWKKELQSSKRKVAGRAYYNMAIYKEINGDVYGALEMAQKAYADYRIGEAENYARILRNRIARIENERQANGE